MPASIGRRRLTGASVSALGVLLAVVNGAHLLAESEAVAAILGGVVPLGLSLALVATGVWMVRLDWTWPSTARLVFWIWVGVLWNTTVGVGVILYEAVEGATLTHTAFLVPVFAAYGSIPGLITGWYDAGRHRRTRTVRRHEEAMDAAIDGMAIVDEAGAYDYVNEAMASLFGYEDPAALRGRPWTEPYPEGERERLRTVAGERVPDAGGWRGETVGERTDGTTFPGELTLTRLADGGMVVIARDVTERRDRTRAMSAIDRVFRHNLNNAMSVVVGAAETLAERRDDEGLVAMILDTSRELLSTVEKERRLVGLLVEDQPRETHDVAALVSELVPEYAARHPDVSFAFDGPAAARAVAIARLDTAVEELLENAAVHGDGDDREVRVTVERRPETVALTVADTGPGIPEMERAVLTEAREQPLYHGSGLGLWLVHWIVRRSGGTVAFTEDDPYGSVVTVELDRAA